MGKPFTRFIAPLALSIAIHAGAVAGISPIFHTPSNARPKIARQVLHEEIEKEKPSLDSLEKEKAKYLQELLSKLKQGEKIPLSGFFTKSQLLDENIYLAEKGQELLDNKYFESRYDFILEQAKEALEHDRSPEALHEFLHTKVFKAYYAPKGDFLNVLYSGEYNCSSSTQFFSALMEDALGETRHKVVIFDDHLQSFLKGFTIENTEHFWKKARKKYGGCGLVAPTELFIAAYLIGNGVEKEELPPRLSGLYAPKRRWEGCPSKGKGEPPPSLWSTLVFPVPGVKSGLDLPTEPIPNPRFGTKPEDIVKTARALRAAHLLSSYTDERDFIKTEINGSEILVKPVLVPADADWAGILDEHALSFSNYKYQSRFPPEITCPLRSTGNASFEAFFGIIEGLAETSRPDLKAYTSKNICRTFREALEKGDYGSVQSKQYHTHCTGLSSSLQELYFRNMGKEDPEWILSFLASMGIKENFDFFLKLSRNQENGLDLAGYGLSLSDPARGCPILKSIGREHPLASNLLVTVCGDKEEAWKQVTETSDNRYLLKFVNGRDLSFAQITELERIANADIGTPACNPGLLEIARIFHEYGNNEKAHEFLSHVISYAEDENSEYSFDFSMGFPAEFIPRLLPLIHQDTQYALQITGGILCNGRPQDIPPEVIEVLRSIVLDRGAEEGRLEAAELLLWMGVDPLPRH